VGEGEPHLYLEIKSDDRPSGRAESYTKLLSHFPCHLKCLIRIPFTEAPSVAQDL
jgi:hypothetical protein